VTAEALDPLIHAPTRLRIVATLAALPEGDALSFTRLQDILELTPGYLSSNKTGIGTASRTSIGLTGRGRAALEAYTAALRGLLGGL
jgi:DNA-binding transcriptional ArsR family regulator